MIASITGMTFLVAGICFFLGVFIAYSLWGIKYYQVFEAESSMYALKRRAEELRSEQKRIHAELNSI